jgi:hypothetical protein
MKPYIESRWLDGVAIYAVFREMLLLIEKWKFQVRKFLGGD